jgi:hypothetical protein
MAGSRRGHQRADDRRDQPEADDQPSDQRTEGSGRVVVERVERLADRVRVAVRSQACRQWMLGHPAAISLPNDQESGLWTLATGR